MGRMNKTEHGDFSTRVVRELVFNEKALQGAIIYTDRLDKRATRVVKLLLRECNIKDRAMIAVLHGYQFQKYAE